MIEQGLSGVKVLDLTWHIAGPYCTKYLADSGGEVIKLERPGTGDPARGIPPFFQDDPHPEKSGLFLHLNTNKRGITLNLKTKKGRSVFRELVKESDLLVESFRPHVLPGLGLGYEELDKLNPRLVMVSISSFGQTGPYREFKATDMIIYGMGGAMFWTGLPDREPLRLGGTVTSYQVGVMAATAAILALYGAEIRGSGEHIDVSAYEVTRGDIDRASTDLIAYQYCGDYDERQASSTVNYPSGIFPCKDGFFDLSGGGVVFFPRVARMLGRPELAKDSRYSSNEGQADVQNREAFLNDLFLPWMMTHTRSELWEAAQKANILSGPILNSKDLLEDPHYRERKYWQEIEHPLTGKLLYPGAPYRAETMGWEVKRPAPLLGQHNEEVYGALGYGKEDLLKFKGEGII
jgi:crotonobetainyl-CoA:carnitine CoA-transferase CaiB-like acyl-CoA transferase